MTASIIISVRNDERIEQCLASIFEDGLSGFNEAVKVIVVENSSEPFLQPVISRFPVAYLVEPVKGIAKARSTGYDEVTGDFVVFTDADCVVGRGWLKSLLAPFQDASVGVVGGPILKHNPRTSVERNQRDLVIGRQTSAQYLLPIYPLPYVVTANAAFRASALAAAGGIDPAFFSCGDVDMAWRVGDLGYRVTIAPDAVVEHSSRPTWRSVFRQFYTYSRGHALLFKKFGRRRGRTFCLNMYPFEGLLRLVKRAGPVAIRAAADRTFAIQIDQMRFEATEYIALVIGAIVGSWEQQVIYI